MGNTPEYHAWENMKQRTLNPNHASHKNYGGRGIKICKRWDKFKNFYADMGDRPSPKHMIDRTDVNGHYEPSNVKWVTRSWQNHNRRAYSNTGIQYISKIKLKGYIYFAIDYTNHETGKRYRKALKTLDEAKILLKEVQDAEK